MIQRTGGTLRPKDCTGGLRRGMIALVTPAGRNGTRLCLAIAVLLLACVLMAGAVSAAEWNVVTTAEDLRSNLTAGNQVKLGESITDSSTSTLIIQANAVLDLNGNTLTFSEIKNAAIAIGNDTANKKGSLTIQDSGENGKIDAKKGHLFWVRNASTLTLDAGSFNATYFVVSTNAKGQWNDPTIVINSGVKLTTTDTAVYIPAQGSKVTITGAEINGGLGGVCVASGDVTIKDTTITVSGQSEPRWNNKDGSADDGSAIVVQKKSSSYKGNVNLKLLGNTVVNGSTADALHNYIRKNPDDPGKTTVTIADTVQFNGALKSYQYDTATRDIGGVFQNENDEILLYPGLSQDGVVWKSDSTNCWTLAISKTGISKLMDDVTTAGITISGENVVLDGNNKKITAKIPSTTSSGHHTAIEVTGKDGTLKNLNLKAEEITITDSSMTYLNAIYAHAGSGSFALSDSILDMSKTSSSQQTMVVHVVGTYSTVTIENNTISSAKSTNSDTTQEVGNHGTSFGIAVEGASISDKLTIDKNTIYPGIAGNSGSIGMRTYALKNAPTNGILINDNVIDFQDATSGQYFSGIHMDQNNEKHDSVTLAYTITGNTIKNLKAGTETDAEKSNKNSGIYLRKVNA